MSDEAARDWASGRCSMSLTGAGVYLPVPRSQYYVRVQARDDVEGDADAASTVAGGCGREQRAGRCVRCG